MLILEETVLEYVKNHAEEDYPNECCGFFFGKDGEERNVTLAEKVANTQDGDQRRRFQIDPKDYQKAEKYALENNLDLLGVYHTHPDHPAEPSEHDRSVALPYFSYIIISVRKGTSTDIRSWKLNEERQFEEEHIRNKDLQNK